MAGSSDGLLPSKFRGCLVGSHVGDCFGAPFEDKPTVYTREWLAKHVAKWAECGAADPSDEGALVFCEIQNYTDDTAMTLCIADSLIENKGFAAKNMAFRFVDEYENSPNRGYGQHVINVFAELRKTDFMNPFRPASRQFDGSGSYGNGAAMRVAPVALYTYDGTDEDAVKLAKEQSLITHTHRNGYNGAILQCLAIRQALKMNPDEIIDPLLFIDSLIEKMAEIEKEEPSSSAGLSREDDVTPYCDSLKWMREVFETAKFVSPKEVAKVIGNKVTAHKSVPTAIYSFLKSLRPSEDFKHSNQFVRAMYHAVSVAGDTDTIAAMTGSISGAYHGLKVIPLSFRARCESIKKSEQAAEHLYELCCGN